MDSRLLRAIGPATLVTVAVVVMVASLAYGGGAAPRPQPSGHPWPVLVHPPPGLSKL